MKLFGSKSEKTNGTSARESGPQLGGRARRLLTETAQIEEELLPTFVRPMLLIILFAFIAFIVWAVITQIKEHAVARGEIIPVSNLKTVQHFDGGTVAEIFVEDRTLVREGQELLRLDGTHTMAELRQLEARQIALRLRAERLNAFAEGRKPEFEQLAESYLELLRDNYRYYDSQIASRDSTLGIYNRQIAQRLQRIEQLDKALAAAEEHVRLTGELTGMREDLASRRLVSRTVLLETRRARVTAEGEVARLKEEIALTKLELGEISSRRTDALNGLHRDARGELQSVLAEAAEVAESIKRATAKVDRLVMRAPHRGFVQDLRVKGVGQVIEGGQVLMQIVPDDKPLEAEIRILPKDIGHVTLGQSVNLRLSSYDYTRFGYAKGVIRRVSATTVTDPKTNDIYFVGWVTLDKPYVGDDPGRYHIQPGMSLEADIVTGGKSMLSYLLRPVIDAFSRSFHER
jgi:HlyD family type I secretion membrane fusion protein